MKDKLKEEKISKTKCYINTSSSLDNNTKQEVNSLVPITSLGNNSKNNNNTLQLQKEEYKESKLQIIPYEENFLTKIINKKQEEIIISNSLNMLHKTQQQWQTSNNKIILGNHPPLEEIKLTHFQLLMTTSPFKIGVTESKCKNNMNIK